jgi:hypothetical protein
MTRRTLFGWLAGLVAGLGGAKVAAAPEPTPRPVDFVGHGTVTYLSEGGDFLRLERLDVPCPIRLQEGEKAHLSVSWRRSC